MEIESENRWLAAQASLSNESFSHHREEKIFICAKKKEREAAAKTKSANHLFLCLVGINNRWPTKGSLLVLSGVLHGLVSLGRVENNKSEGNSRLALFPFATSTSTLKTFS